MSRHDFMQELKKRLRKLPFDEIREAVEYYEQYFNDAGEENEQAVLAELGPPANVASHIIADFAIKGADKETSVKYGLSTIWVVILAIFASPIALPLALTVAILALSLVIVILSFLISTGAMGLGLFAGGIIYAVISIPLFFQSFSTALFALGIGLLSLGIGAALLIATAALSKRCFNWLTKRVGKFILRRNGK